MAFDSLTEKLQNIFKNLRSKGRLTEDDVKEALKEIKRALLAADVNFKVVKDFVKSVQERAVGQDVMNGLNPGQMVIKIVNEELVKLMGSQTTEIKLQPGSAITVIMMAEETIITLRFFFFIAVGLKVVYRIVPNDFFRYSSARRRSMSAVMRPDFADSHAVCASRTLLTGITPSLRPSVAYLRFSSASA